MQVDKPYKKRNRKVSKLMLERINTEIREKTKVNQWRNTSAVLEWFNSMRKIN